jgi:hypothetical protein
MPGYLWTESGAGRWSRLAEAAQLRTLAANVAVGVLAGVAIAHIRLHLGLPGHKAVLWMTPIIAARLLCRHPAGAMAGASAAALTSIALGGNLAGGILFVPLVTVAGAVLDAAVGLARRAQLASWLLIGLVGVAGMGANLLCAIKRLLLPMSNHHVLFGLSGTWALLAAYATFGLTAGIIGATLGLGVRRACAKRQAVTDTGR